MAATLMQNLMKRALSDKSARNSESMNKLASQMSNAEFNPWIDGETA